MYKILIVDDEQIERDGVRFLLNKFAYPFEIAARNNGREALAFLREQPVDVSAPTSKCRSWMGWSFVRKRES